MRWTIAFLMTLFPILVPAQNPPNVILIITDDQGYGDFGFTGNSIVKTPNIDRLSEEGILFSNFHVSPVCAPTRSSLLTGRYSLRTGVRDTYNGGAIMASNEITIAEVLQENGYHTGMFGKWHLGDNYPTRPIDQGFDESVIHLAGGMGQVGDITTYFQYDRSYYDPVLWKNGKQHSYSGYCSDVFTDQAMEFIQRQNDQPFFCYLSYNAPHTPLQVPVEWLREYEDIPDEQFQNMAGSNMEMSKKDIKDARRIYAMVSNIDSNLGRLFSMLEQTGKAENTIIIFMTDNGPQQRRYVSGFRGRKGSVYEGGIRVPLIIRHPEYSGGQTFDQLTAHLDMLPTIAEFCGIKTVKPQIDGMSLVPILEKQGISTDNRIFLSYWTRKYPEKYRNISLHKGNFKLVGNTNSISEVRDFELYDLSSDPSEKINIISDHLPTASSLRQSMDSLLSLLTKSPNLLDPPLIAVGRTEENPVILNRNDAGGQRGIWAQDNVFGHWNVDIVPGQYDVIAKFRDYVPGGGTLNIELGNQVYLQSQEFASDNIVLKNLTLPEVQGILLPFYTVNDRRFFPFWIELKKN